MFTESVMRRLRPFLVVLLALGVWLAAAPALAAGRVEWKSKELKEREGGSWRIELSIFMPKAPDVAHVPMKFEFQPIAYYERSMVDGDKLLERVVPLEHRQSLIESVDVGFMDSGTGKIEKRTRFSFKVTRAHGYEAGEYKVTIRDTRNGQTIGTPTTLKFQGENEVIDRRAMVFSGKKEKEKKKDETPAKEGGEAAESSSADSEAAPAQDASSSEAASAEADAPAAEESSDGEGSDGPPAIEEKPGGCGCRVPGSPAPFSASGAVALLLLAGALVSRRKLRM